MVNLQKCAVSSISNPPTVSLSTSYQSFAKRKQIPTGLVCSFFFGVRGWQRQLIRRGYIPKGQPYKCRMFAVQHEWDHISGSSSAPDRRQDDPPRITNCSKAETPNVTRQGSQDAGEQLRPQVHVESREVAKPLSTLIGKNCLPL